MKHIAQPAMVDDPARPVSAADSRPPVRALPGHLRVREATAEERKGFTSLFPDPEHGRWVEQTLQTGRSWIPVVERFENRKWIPIGLAVVDATGQMAFGFLPPYRGRGFFSAAIRAVIQYLREYTLTVLTVRLSDREPHAARAFERAGFAFLGLLESAGRIERQYEFVIRGECKPLNVWI